MQFNIIEVISIIAITQSLLLALFFITLKNGDKRSNRILSTILVIFVILITSSFFLTRGVSIQFLKIIIICNQFALIVGPLIYIYMNSILRKNFHFKIYDILHFIPFILVTFYLVMKFYILNDFASWQSIIRIFGSGIFLIQSFVYIICCFYKLKSFRIYPKKSINKNQMPGLKWIRFILIGFIGIWLINMHTFIVLDLWKKHGLCPYMFSIYFLIAFILLNVFLMITMKEPKLFITPIKYKNSNLSDEDKREYYKKMLSYIEKYKPYRDPLFNLIDFSKQIGITMCYVSQIINELLNQNFYDFINHYRIEESKQLLMNSSNGRVNILDVAYKVGFNSKSAFNKAFKKFTGVTPREFRKMYCSL